MRIAVTSLVIACSAAPSTPAPVAVPVLPDVSFALLDREQRVQFMKERVVPAMAPLFRAHDARPYDQFGCTTCHGDSTDYVMPNPALPRLDTDRSRHDARAIEWMTTTIRPAIARILDEEIDCMRCHVRETR